MINRLILCFKQVCFPPESFQGRVFSFAPKVFGTNEKISSLRTPRLCGEIKRLYHTESLLPHAVL